MITEIENRYPQIVFNNRVELMELSSLLYKTKRKKIIESKEMLSFWFPFSIQHTTQSLK